MRSLILVFSLLVVALPVTANAVELKGSREAVLAAKAEAELYDYSFLSSRSQLNRFVELGLLVRLEPNGDFELSNVSVPFVRPEVRLFIRRLSRQYNEACGEKLVVTSALRLTVNQPSNASLDSVHPTGMAVDLRIPTGDCRTWLQNTLLILEERRVADVTRERRPPHYHVVVYSKKYGCYVKRRTGEGICDGDNDYFVPEPIRRPVWVAESPMPISRTIFIMPIPRPEQGRM